MDRIEQTGADDLAHVVQGIGASRRRLVGHRPVDVGNQYRIRRIGDKRLQPLLARAQRVLGRRIHVPANPPQHLKKQQREPHADRQDYRGRDRDRPLRSKLSN
ncbi:hypothetical protein AYM40_32575 [Paraburkholderia phytofirmans OLGA172]|uniref:Uncharacterized protein n=1 Tax=Paraburkholderia phytofirmans OLGA172 TaxID=1417228 RepID=A0A161I000_9BURK|nr:hypothetical protein AYM40_32575 [Paraburkholderia phytofirmans OLGA172]